LPTPIALPRDLDGGPHVDWTDPSIG